MANFPSESKLRFWAENGLNVLFEGPHGVGKTALAEQTFNEVFGQRGKDWIYFSAATMDPWVDFVGVPKDREASDGVVYLDLIRPEVFARDRVKAIIFDEFNRAPKKVRNAVMELMQFKSINGHKFESLRCIWAAVNPADDDENDYDVEEIDPAQRDRFHVHFQFGYDVSIAYFNEKYGEKGTVACEWWRSLTKELKKSISPRRLDYCMFVESLGGSIKDILPAGAPCKELLTQLKSGSFLKILEEIKNGGMSKDDMKRHLSDQNFYSFVENKVRDDDALAAKLVPHMSSENVAKFLESNSIKKVKRILDSVEGDVTEFTQTLKDLVGSANNIAQTKRAKIETWLIRRDSGYTYNGPSMALQEFLSTVPTSVFYETKPGRNNRIQAFINLISDDGLNTIKNDEDLRAKVTSTWLTILDRGQLKTLTNDILERVSFTINKSKKEKIQRNFINFFAWNEFDLPNTDKRMEKIASILNALRTGKFI